MKPAKTLSLNTLRSKALLFLGVALIGAGCNDSLGNGGGSTSGNVVSNVLTSVNVGQEVFKIYRVSLQNSNDNPAARVAALDLRETDFVDAVNTILAPTASQGVGNTLAAILEMVDDGSLPAISEGVASALEMTLSSSDPSLKTLSAFLALGDSKTVLQVDDLLAFSGRFMNYPELQSFLTQLATLIENNDGVDASGLPNGERDLVTDFSNFLSQTLASVSLDATGAGASRSFVDELLVEANLAGQTSFGAPAWAVYVDKNGNAAVGADPTTGILLPPFVDSDKDGVADVDSSGSPVDANGQVIDLPPFGGGSLQDQYGRPVTTTGYLVYLYFDAKKTLLSLFLQNTAKLLENDFHTLSYEVFTELLGPRNVTYDNGTADPADDYLGYSDNTALHDWAWGILQMGRNEELGKILAALAEMVEQDPDRGERLLVGLGVAIDRLKTVQAAPGNGQTGSLLSDLIPILDQVLENGSSGSSTARNLFSAIEDTHIQARELPKELALMIRYRETVLETVPDGDSNRIDEAKSTPVDWTKPSSYTVNGLTVDNRSDLHELLDLLAHFDSCQILGKSMAQWVLEIAADMSPQSVSGLINVVNSTLGNFFANLVCPGANVSLAALDNLAASGGLDGLLPLLKVFKDRGEMPLCIHLLKTFQANYESSIRPSEPFLIEVLESGAVEEVLDLLGEATTITVPSTNENAADVFADFLAALVEDDYPVATRTGGVTTSQLSLLIDPAEQISSQLSGTSSASSLGELMTTLAEPVLERYTNDNGTPNDASDDFEQLQNRSFVPFISRVLSILSQAIPDDANDRAKMIDSAEDLLASIWKSPHLGPSMEVGEVLMAQQNSTLTAALVAILTPQAQAQDDVFGSLLKILVTVLQSKQDVDDMETVIRFLGRVIDPSLGLAVPLVRGLAHFFAKDQGQLAISLFQAALNPAAGQTKSPVGILLDIANEVKAQGSGGGISSASQLDAEIADMISFIRDDQDGLAALFKTLTHRTVP